MSGKAKRIVYYTVSAVCLLLAVACCVLMLYSVYRDSEKSLYTVFSFLLFCAATVLTNPGVLVHECGHLFFGACAGLKPVSVRVGWLVIANKKIRFSFSFAAGKTEFISKEGKNVRKKIMIASLGGAAFNFIFGAASAALFFVFSASPIALFFALFAPVHFYTAIDALLPAELSAGCTDGETFLRLKNNTLEGRLFCTVLTAQSILQKHTFDDVEKPLLFETPVVREDDEAFLSLLHLRWQYLMWHEDVEGAKKELFRLEELSEYLDPFERAQIKCDAVFMRRILGMEQSESEEMEEARGTLSYERAELALGRGDISQIKKSAAQQSYAGIRALELKFVERFIQNF